jgi:hypothetical protein
MSIRATQALANCSVLHWWRAGEFVEVVYLEEADMAEIHADVVRASCINCQSRGEECCTDAVRSFHAVEAESSFVSHTEIHVAWVERTSLL